MSSNQDWIMKMVPVKAYNTIAKICLKVCSQQQIHAMKLIDEKEAVIFSVQFNTLNKDEGRWKITEVYEDQVICGIAVNTTKEDYIGRLSFFTATIDNYNKVDRSNVVPKFITRKFKFGKAPDAVFKEMWPQPKELAKISRPMKLNGIRYKHRDNDFNLSGIQLCFTNGYRTPMFESDETKESAQDNKLIKIDPEKNIAAIAMKVDRDDWLRGLKLISDEQEVLCDVTWCSYRDDGRWIWKYLEDYEQIVGIAVDKETETEYIKATWLIGSDQKAPVETIDTSGTWRPKICRPISFGAQVSINERSIQNVESLHRFNTMPKIVKINYKCLSDEGGLTSFQMVFDDGFKTPVSETDYGEFERDNITTIRVKPYNKIT